MNPLEYVSTLQGTNSHYGFSTGNTLPLTAMPFGMVHWSPQTSTGSNWFFDPRERKLIGIRATHQPSPWIGDYGWFLITPQTGERHVPMRTRAAAATYESHPHRLSCNVLRDSSSVEMAPTERGAIFVFKFGGRDGRVILQAGDKVGSIRVDASTGRFEAISRTSNGGAPAGFGCHYVGTFDRELVSFSLFESGEIVDDSEGKTGMAVGAVLEFQIEPGEQLTLRVASSFISAEQAWHNLESELQDLDLEHVTARSEKAWNHELGKFSAESDSDDRLRTFYSCLYRTLLFPRFLNEPKPEGGVHHYSPYDDNIHDGPIVTDNGFWDTYRTMYPLLSLVSPSRLGEILAGWVNCYLEGGWFPQWVSPGFRACMVGTHIDAVFADAAVKGISGFDLAKAYEGLRKHAFEPGDERGSYGRLGIASYLEKGYVPNEEHEGAIARSLDYAYDDFCLSQIARILGRHEDAALFESRAFNYRTLYDPESGFMRGRTAGGEWSEPWHPFIWGHGYVEGGPWQSSFAVQHDPQGLADLMGGPEKLAGKIEAMMTAPVEFDFGSYNFEIHEMTEMASAGFGQYAQSNQPVHHVLYMAAAVGHPEITQEWVRAVMDSLYSPQNLPGDEDNGEMSAWYVLSAMGLFPLCPGHPSYVFGTPMFKKLTMKRENLPDLVIEASGEGIYVDKIFVDGREHSKVWIGHDELCECSALRFELTAARPQRKYHSDELPFSLSRKSPS